ncbi:MAG: LysR family transcriptional regulator [Bdellovibrionales bacterium]|nr:LysR family transcriptional regulator [Bdellovibrionales bacterium]
MLTLPNFERLKVFHIVYLSRSIQKAADVLNLTRSAVSQSLKSLEGELGSTLFIRDSKKFQATSQADDLFRAIDPFVSELHSTLRQMESGKKMPVGHLKVGAPMDFGSGHLTRVIGKFRKVFPCITFELQLGVPIKQLDMLCRGELDMAFIDNGDIHAQRYPVTIQSVAEEEFVLVSTEENVKVCGLRDASYAHLSKANFVDYLSHAPVARMWFKHHFKRVPPDLKVSYSAESVRAVLTAIKGEIGIGVVPKHLLEGEFKHLTVIAGPRKPFVNQIMIARQAGKNLTAKEQAFIKFFREAT